VIGWTGYFDMFYREDAVTGMTNKGRPTDDRTSEISELIDSCSGWCGSPGSSTRTASPGRTSPSREHDANDAGLADKRLPSASLSSGGVPPHTAAVKASENRRSGHPPQGLRKPVTSNTAVRRGKLVPVGSASRSMPEVVTL